MTKDYRRGGIARPTPRRKPGHSCSCIWWFLLGVILGAFGVGLYWTQGGGGTATNPEGVPGKVERPTQAPPSFEFPNLLRETEVDISTGPAPPPPAPRPELPAPVEAEAEAASIVTTTGKGFIVQIGSFKRGADAERLKAELALLGVPSRVEVATMANGQTFHRVRAGPYPNKGAAEKVQALLKRNGKDSMTIPVK